MAFGKRGRKLSPPQQHYLQRAWQINFYLKTGPFLLQRAFDELQSATPQKIAELANHKTVRADSQKSIKDFVKSIRTLIHQYGADQEVGNLLYG
jgi:hypothetical protein